MNTEAQLTKESQAVPSHQRETTKDCLTLENSQGRQNLGPMRVINLAPNQDILLSGFHAILTDNDDTLSRGSGELAHDGPRGAYAMLLSRKLFEAMPALTEGTQFHETGSLFETEDEWRKYRQVLGKPPAVNIECLYQTAEVEFADQGLHIPRNPADIDLIDELYRGQGIEVMEHISSAGRDTNSHWLEVIEPDRHLLDFIRSADKPIAMVTASGEVYTDTILKLNDLDKVFKVRVCNASKKTNDGFSGADIIRACEELGVDPKNTIMFGDSMSDIGAAKLAGVPITIIRLYDHHAHSAGATRAPVERHNKLEQEIKKFRENPDNIQKMASSQYPLQVFIVDCFSQVKLSHDQTYRGDTPHAEIQTRNEH